MSTIFADNFKNTSGGDPVNINEVKTDKLTGKTTAGSITIQGEGTATTNLQQGLAKGWITFNGTGTIAILDSFNFASITDRAQGKYTMTIANDMANAMFVQSGNAKKEDANEDPNQTVVFGAGTGYTKLASEVQMTTGRNADLFDTASAECVINGDLA